MVADIRHRDVRSRWNGVVHFDLRTLPLDGIRIMRPGMRHLERSSTTAISPNDELRLSRTIGALTYPIWKKIHQYHVLVIECGRNGTLAAQQFA